MIKKEYVSIYRDYLLDRVVPFWLEHSLDLEFGGYFTCLQRDGSVFDTDKFVWLQCREVWTFSMLYNNVEQRQEWLDAALMGADFLLRHGRDNQGNWYFSLDRKGLPLMEAHSIFSDCFAAMAFAQLYKATQDRKYSEVAKNTFEIILQRKEAPKGRFSKTYSGTRDIKGFSLPMILCNLVLEIEHLLDESLVESVLREGVHEVMDIFYKPDLGVILENVALNGGIVDSFEGRLVNPGHGLESMWFVMDIARRWGDTELVSRCTEIILQLLEFGWDTKYGGIFYFRDIKGFPPQQLEWDQKLWWVHLEALIAVVKGYEMTGDTRLEVWIARLHEYIWNHFVDPEYGEMFGYLKRDGALLVDSKGGKWKGFFHVPRALFQLWKLMEKIVEKQALVLDETKPNR